MGSYNQTNHSIAHRLSPSHPVMGWIAAPQNSYVEVLTPSISECDLIGEKGFPLYS